jgi:hypothetical protein
VIHGPVSSRPRIVPAISPGERRNKWAIEGSYVLPVNREETFLRERQDASIWHCSSLWCYGISKIGTSLAREPDLGWVLGTLGATR